VVPLSLKARHRYADRLVVFGSGVKASAGACVLRFGRRAALACTFVFSFLGAGINILAAWHGPKRASVCANGRRIIAVG